MKILKRNKGITLVALIITIIVLLILAVVAIGAIRNDGIINYAKNARIEYEQAKANEQGFLDEYEGYLENVNTPVGGVEETLATIEIGDFVEYNVAYTDVMSGYNYTTTNGWRILDYQNEENGVYSGVRLISTGCPATLYTNFSSGNATDNNEWWGTNGNTNDEKAAYGLLNNFREIKFSYTSDLYNTVGINKGGFTSITVNGTTYGSSHTGEISAADLFNPTGRILENGPTTFLTTLTMEEVATALLGNSNAEISPESTNSGAVDTKGIYMLNQLKNISGMETYSYNSYIR